MTSDQFISVRETAQILGVSEKKVMDLVETGKLQAYRIANQFIRFKRGEVDGMKSAGSVAAEVIQYEYTSSERLQDFIYFYDYYIISGLIILFLLYIIFFV